MNLNSQTTGDCIYRGAFHGAVAWTIYAIVECCFATILTWMVKPGYAYVPLHWGFTCILFVSYLFIGLIFGGLSGLVLSTAARRVSFLQKVEPDKFLAAFATFSVLSAYVINFIVNYSGSFGLSELPPLSICLLLIVALALSAGSSIWFSHLRFLTNPWTASIVLLGLPWINSELFAYSSLVKKGIAALTYPSTVFLISFVLQTILQAHRSSQSMFPRPHTSTKYILSLALAGFSVLAISSVLKQQPIFTSLNSNSSNPGPNRPNVILIVMDTVRADHLSLYGYERETTPNLRKLSEEATVYMNAIAPSDITVSTHASIFTGLYPSSHGAHYGLEFPLGRKLDGSFHTLSEILSKKGYLTMGIVANHAALGSTYNLNQGFNYYDARLPV
ncbi:MAG: sulfatase-like hydrolase/transferase, partial [Candidatus Aenigmarchaeota archaeon]|nr:sulfatase-like hydrolase/transferase [Candidatus Aenigmarchaeota archaeon]